MNEFMKGSAHRSITHLNPRSAMKPNPNTGAKRFLRFLWERWYGEDYPGATPRFFWKWLVSDIAVFILLPIGAIFIYKSFDGKKNTSPPAHLLKPNINLARNEALKSQIINFAFRARALGLGPPGLTKKSPGTLVKLKLQNVVETYSTAPVHAQIIDAGLGSNLVGGSLIGDATADSNFDRITINFRYVRDPKHEGEAYGIGARALALDGTLGILAVKKEGFVSRAALGSAATTSQSLQNQNSSTDFKDILLRALTTGLFDQMGSATQVAKNQANVLSLIPGVEFFAELTDFFPGGLR